MAEKDFQAQIDAGENVVLGYCAVNGILGAIPFLTGPLLLVSDYTLFLAVKRAMGAQFRFGDVFTLVAPTVKATFAFSLFKMVADAFGWSWLATIPIGFLVSAATTYALGMCFVHFNARDGKMTSEEAEGTMREAAFRYLETKAQTSKHMENAKSALDAMFKKSAEQRQKA